MSKPKKTNSTKTPVQPTLTPGMRVSCFTINGDGPHVARIIGTVPGYAVVQVADKASSYNGEVHAVTLDRIGIIPAAA